MSDSGQPLGPPRGVSPGAVIHDVYLHLAGLKADVQRLKVQVAALQEAQNAAQAGRLMPNVTGLRLHAAEAAIRATFTDPQITVQHVSGPAPPGTVIAQSPAAGSPIASARGFRLTVVDDAGQP